MAKVGMVSFHTVDRRRTTCKHLEVIDEISGSGLKVFWDKVQSILAG